MAHNNEIDLRRFFRTIRRHIALFAATFIVIAGLALTFAMTRAPRFTTSATMLIEDSSSDSPQRSIGGGSGMLGMMMRSFSIGGFGNANVDNEMLLVTSHDILLRTVERLNLNVKATERRGLTTATLWGDSPVELIASDSVGFNIPNRKSITVKVAIHDRHVDIKATEGFIFKDVIAEKRDATLPTILSTPYGTMTLMPTKLFDSADGRTIKFIVRSYDDAADKLYREIDIAVADKVSDGIGMQMTNSCPEMARDVLDTMMDEYNHKRIERRQVTARAEVDFLNDRIERVFSSIADTEQKIEQYKTDNRFVDIEKEAPILFGSSLEAHETLLKARAEMVYCEQVLSTLESNPNSLLPAYTTPGGEAEGNPMVTAYNQQMMSLNELRRSAMPGNHALQLAEERVADMRQAVITSISQTLASARKVINERSGVVGQMDAQLGRLPKFEREFINLSRDNLLQNELYALLVEKRESALLRYHSDSSLGFIVDQAYTDVRPSPVKKIVISLVGILVALGACVALALWFMRRNNTVDQPLDLHDFSLEDNAIEFRTNSEAEANRLRGMLMSLNCSRNLFIAELSAGCRDAEAAFKESLRRADLVADDIADLPGNDAILSPDFKGKLQPAGDSKRFVVADVPNGATLPDVAPVINAADAATLLLLKAGSVDRKAFKSLIAGLNPDRILVGIVGY